MKKCILMLCLVAFNGLFFSSMANAEIYKWKDKDGKIRYSDVPPASNVKQEALYGKKIPKPTGQAPLAEVPGDATVAQNKQKANDLANKDKTAKDKPLSKDEAAAKRAADAEEQKKADEAKEAELKLKQQNCLTAKANLKTHIDGGRLVRTNEKGEREYLSDKDINQGKIDSQRDVDKYCDS